MAIIDITDDQSDYVTPDPYVRNEILVNQLGYTVGLEKKATMVDDSTSPKTFEIKTKDGETVYTGSSILRCCFLRLFWVPLLPPSW